MSVVAISTVSGAVTDQDQTTVPVVLKLIIFSPGTTASTLIVKDGATTLFTIAGNANSAPVPIPLDGLQIPTKLTVTTTGTGMGAVFFK